MASFPRWVRSEGAGYFAMVAFLSAYLLNVMDSGQPIQTILNLLGAAVAASYLHKKRAFPSVISNMAWIGITIGGAVAGEENERRLCET